MLASKAANWGQEDQQRDSFREDDAPYQPISQRVGGLTYAEGEEAAFAVDASRADAHRVPAHLVQHHSDAVDLVGLDADRSGTENNMMVEDNMIQESALFINYVIWWFCTRETAGQGFESHQMMIVTYVA